MGLTDVLNKHDTGADWATLNQLFFTVGHLKML